VSYVQVTCVNWYGSRRKLAIIGYAVEVYTVSKISTTDSCTCCWCGLNVLPSTIAMLSAINPVVQLLRNCVPPCTFEIFLSFSVLLSVVPREVYPFLVWPIQFFSNFMEPQIRPAIQTCACAIFLYKYPLDSVLFFSYSISHFRTRTWNLTCLNWTLWPSIAPSRRPYALRNEVG
jgi:hypothetical protein